MSLDRNEVSGELKEVDVSVEDSERWWNLVAFYFKAS
jgi:hypothetical protein